MQKVFWKLFCHCVDCISSNCLLSKNFFRILLKLLLLFSFTNCYSWGKELPNDVTESFAGLNLKFNLKINWIISSLIQQIILLHSSSRFQLLITFDFLSAFLSKTFVKFDKICNLKSACFYYYVFIFMELRHLRFKIF